MSCAQLLSNQRKIVQNSCRSAMLKYKSESVRYLGTVHVFILLTLTGFVTDFQLCNCFSMLWENSNITPVTPLRNSAKNPVMVIGLVHERYQRINIFLACYINWLCWRKTMDTYSNHGWFFGRCFKSRSETWISGE